MNPNKEVLKLIEQQRRILKQYSDMLKPTIQALELLNIPKIEVPEVEIPKINIPKIDFPTFPKIEFPEIIIDYENIEKLANNNSLRGWTLSGEIDTSFYLNEELLDRDQDYIDEYFLNYFESDSQKNLLIMKNSITNSIDDKWKSVVEDCFLLYKTDKYKITIPMLITIIEGEISKIAESNKVGYYLLKDWEEIINPEDKLMFIVTYTLHQFLAGEIFASKNFNDERGTNINRNWVLHGRDNPSLWTRTDVLKLMNIISTLQFVQDK
ncbi:hypothetical protein [Gracilibacillus saliphilus]|uniref:hypothetical protein n=1 Tax=Gracilibacillus saliphilus TaxID=543890 RepID=UPI0013D4C6C6|nr:hypothetical protein [Gracilibacillus saliphilus]